MNDASVKEKIAQLHDLLASLNKETHYRDKLAILNTLPIVQEYIQQPGPIQAFLKILTPESEFAMKAIIAIGQAPVVFNTKNLGNELFNKLLILLEQLLDIEVFYSYLGGMIGYHLTMLQLIYNQFSPTVLF